MRAFSAVLAAVLLMAGCAAPSERATADPTLPDPLSSSPTATQPPPAPAGTAVAAVDVALERTGRTWTTACVVAPPAIGQCQHAAEGSAITEPLPAGEPVLRLRGTLQWEGGTEVMGIGVVDDSGDEPRMVEGAYAEGPSPLAFDLDLSAAANATLGFHVASYANVGAGPANAGVSPGQDWSMAATLTVLRVVS